MSSRKHPPGSFDRRQFLQLGSSAGLIGAARFAYAADAPTGSSVHGASAAASAAYNGIYEADRLNRVAFPMGGIGAGMVCLEGTGALSHVSVRNTSDLLHEPTVFAAVHLQSVERGARILEGPVPRWKISGSPGSSEGLDYRTYGLPRFTQASFSSRFPFGTVELRDDSLPLRAQITGWSPFVPGDADSSSLPVAALEYRLANPSARSLEGVLSFNARNFMIVGDHEHGVLATPGGFALWGAAGKQAPRDQGAFAVSVNEPGACINHAWFRSPWFDAFTMAWRDVENGACFDRPPVSEGSPARGGSVFVPFSLASGASHTITVRLAWYVPHSFIRWNEDEPVSEQDLQDASKCYRPWYATRFANIDEVVKLWTERYADLRQRTETFTRCFYDSTLPPEVLEAVSANLSILKSPTVLREEQGRLWGWEASGDRQCNGPGSCTHVWNYAQAVPHLFPSLERSLREIEFLVSQDERGHQAFRAAMPIRPPLHTFYAAADGQLGGIMKVYREWRISGDTQWLRRLWPKVRQSLDYCIETWDPARRGWAEEPHHNTYDIEFWGPDGMSASFYLGALRAAVLMGRELHDDVREYQRLLDKGVRRVEAQLFNGEYFFQHVEWKTLRASDPTRTDLPGITPHADKGYSAEGKALLEKEGPRYQYGSGCLADGVLGSWLAQVCGFDQPLDPAKVASHVLAVYRHNLIHDLSLEPNTQRPGFACGPDGGLRLCTWPRGDEPSLPMVYSKEVWCGIEYQVASHLIMTGRVAEGLEIVRICRDRYDGRARNPFAEVEWGRWYSRSMSSYALLQALSGARYDAVDRVLHLTPAIEGDFRCFLSTASGYGTVGVRDGKPFLDVKSGSIDVTEIRYRPAARGTRSA